jgi:indole-3-glycerol phosphate synthase
VDILSQIILAKRQRLAAAKGAQPVAQLREQALELRELVASHAFKDALKSTQRLNIISEFKRRSPSKGLIRADADPVRMSLEYEQGGAVAVSVLTEEDYFDGLLADLRAVRQAIKLPILRKDFIFDEYQVWESAAAGADALLLIVAALTDKDLRSLRELAEEELGMDALVEVHSSDELKRAVVAGATLVGVNNRDLRTFNVSLETSVTLAREAPAGVTLISESGLRNSVDLRRLQASGYQGFLIGETLMRAERPGEALQTLIGSQS